jgi:hypothetical protein
MSSRRFCGEVELLKLIDAYIVSDKVTRVTQHLIDCETWARRAMATRGLLASATYTGNPLTLTRETQRSIGKFTRPTYKVNPLTLTRGMQLQIGKSTSTFKGNAGFDRL